MRAEWRVPVAWAALLLGVASLQLIFTTRVIGWELLGGAAGATLVLGLLLYPLRRRGEPRERAVPDSSWATVLAAIGATTALNGLAFGRWLLLPGLGLLAIGLGGVVREHLAARRRGS